MSALPLPEPHESDAATQALPLVEPTPGSDEAQRSTRTPLSVVPGRKPKRRRVPFVLLCIVIVGAVVAAVLGMNIKTAGTQYDLVRINAKTQEMHQSNQATTQELDYRKAPQNLAAQAKKAGMVAAGRPGVVDLDSQKVTAKASAPAEGTGEEKETDTSTTLDTPMSPAELSALAAKKQAAIRERQRAKAEAKAGTSAATSQETKSTESETASGTSGAGTKDGTKTDTESEQSGDTATGTKKKSAGAGDNDDKDARGFSDEDLNGGTIPAPATH